MEQLCRERLVAAVRRYPDIITNARRCEAIMRDLCGETCRPEISAILGAVRMHAPQAIAESAGVPMAILVPRLGSRLHDETGVEKNLAMWAVTSWAIALGKARVSTAVAPIHADPGAAPANVVPAVVHHALPPRDDTSPIPLVGDENAQTNQKVVALEHATKPPEDPGSAKDALLGCGCILVMIWLAWLAWEFIRAHI